MTKDIAALAATLVEGPQLIVSTDVFDTLVFRDHSTEIERLARSCRRAARILGVAADPLIRARWNAQEIAYRTVAAEGGLGEASLARISTTITEILGYGPAAADVLHRVEVDTDVEHLRPHRELIDVLGRAAASGKEVIAVSDTYYGADDLSRILRRVLGGVVVSRIYSSADAGATKHAGGLYDVVAKCEGVRGDQVLHVGDNHAVDVRMARASSWRALHLPRGRGHTLAKATGRLRAVPTGWRRWW